MIFLDFTKAFDRIPYDILICKLEKYNFSWQFINWIANFLSQRSQVVTINGISSTPVQITSGVPQGTILAPLLFSLFINDLFSLELSHDSRFSAYVDDTKLYGPVPSAKNLANDLELIAKWTAINSVGINFDKCGVIYFGANNPKFPYTLSGNVLPVVETYKDLGIVIEAGLSFSNHVNHLVRKCFVISKLLLKSFSRENPQLHASLLRTYILPMLFDGIPFFIPYSVDLVNQLEKIQRRFTKRLLSRRNLDYPSRLAILNLQPIEISFIKLGLAYIYKMIHFSSPISSSLPTLLCSSTRNSEIRFQQELC